MFPMLPYNQNYACLPETLGWTFEHASKYYNLRKNYGRCNDKKYPFMRISNNKLIINCTISPTFTLGHSPDQEVLGPPFTTVKFTSYSEPVDIQDREYVYGKCGKDYQAILLNKKKQKAADRAQRITDEINTAFNITNPRKMTMVWLVIDSLSRQSFYRNFPKTIEFLNNQLVTGKYKDTYVGYDFLINNVMGGNTYPNMVPMIYGYNRTIFDKFLGNINYRRSTDKNKFESLQNDAV